MRLPVNARDGTNTVRIQGSTLATVAIKSDSEGRVDVDEVWSALGFDEDSLARAKAAGFFTGSVNEDILTANGVSFCEKDHTYMLKVSRGDETVCHKSTSSVTSHIGTGFSSKFILRLDRVRAARAARLHPSEAARHQEHNTEPSEDVLADLVRARDAAKVGTEMHDMCETFVVSGISRIPASMAT